MDRTFRIANASLATDILTHGVDVLPSVALPRSRTRCPESAAPGFGHFGVRMDDTTTKLTHAHLEFERAMRELVVGKTIHGIEYINSDLSFLGKPNKPEYHTHVDGIDSTDCGIRLRTADGAMDVCWDATFFHYGVKAFPIEQSPMMVGPKAVWEVSDETLWKDFIGQRIVDLAIFWETVVSGIETPKTSSNTYPQCFLLRMSNGKEAFISASAFINAGNATAMCFMDNLLVTTNRVLAEEVKMFFPN